jgi:hypothetical protein
MHPRRHAYDSRIDTTTQHIIETALSYHRHNALAPALDAVDEALRAHAGAELDFGGTGGSSALGEDTAFGTLLREAFGGATQDDAIDAFVARYRLTLKRG